MTAKPMNSDQQADFEKLAAQQGNTGLLRDFWDFLRTNKKWWLLPILLALLGLMALAALSATPAGPFIYTLF